MDNIMLTTPATQVVFLTITDTKNGHSIRKDHANINKNSGGGQL
jgi:hypothetical protein